MMRFVAGGWFMVWLGVLASGSDVVQSMRRASPQPPSRKPGAIGTAQPLVGAKQTAVQLYFAPDDPPASKHMTQGPESPEPISFQIARHGTATVDDAYRIFVGTAIDQRRLPSQQSARALSFEPLQRLLVSLELIDPGWKLGPEDCLRRDVLAYMAASYLGCPPGLITSLFGKTRRYAHREMLYQGVIGPGAPSTLVSGSELLSVATRVARRFDLQSDVTLSDQEIQ